MNCGRFATFFTSAVTQRKIFMILPLSHATNSLENFLYFFIDKAYALMYSMFLLRNTTEVNKCASGSAVEHHLAKVGAAGSIPVSRLQKNSLPFMVGCSFAYARRGRTRGKASITISFRKHHSLPVGSTREITSDAPANAMSRLLYVGN